jgi:hypothetical protein
MFTNGARIDADFVIVKVRNNWKETKLWKIKYEGLWRRDRDSSNNVRKNDQISCFILMEIYSSYSF